MFIFGIKYIYYSERCLREATPLSRQRLRGWLWRRAARQHLHPSRFIPRIWRLTTSLERLPSSYQMDVGVISWRMDGWRKRKNKRECGRGGGPYTGEQQYGDGPLLARPLSTASHTPWWSQYSGEDLNVFIILYAKYFQNISRVTRGSCGVRHHPARHLQDPS